jgi:hypothetical protein
MPTAVDNAAQESKNTQEKGHSFVKGKLVARRLFEEVGGCWGEVWRPVGQVRKENGLEEVEPLIGRTPESLASQPPQLFVAQRVGFRLLPAAASGAASGIRSKPTSFQPFPFR